MDFILNYLQSGLSAVGPFLVLLGLLIFVHELGHFLVAKWCGVQVDVFSLGFGKKILKAKMGDTTYCISAIPLGGYVKMYGDDPTSKVPPEEQKRAFLYKPVSQRIAIVLAGPLMNFLFAIPLFIAVGLNGEKVPGPGVGDIKAETAAYEAGFRSGDKILSINGQEVANWHQIQEMIENSPEKEMEFHILRMIPSSEELFIKSTPKWVANDNILSLDTHVAKIPGLVTSGRAAIVGVPHPNSSASKAGLSSLDIISSVNGKKVFAFRELNPVLESLTSAESLEFKVKNYIPDEKLVERMIVLKDLQALLSQRRPGQSMIDLIGVETPDLYLLKVKKDSPAFKAGLKDGDKIFSLNGKNVTKWTHVLEAVKTYKSEDNPIHFTVQRQGKIIKLDITPQMTNVINRRQQEEQRFTVGIIPAILDVPAESVLFRVTDPIEAVKFGFNKTIEWTQVIAVSFLRIVTAQVSHKNIGGVITIGRVASQSFEVGVSAFLRMMAIISINLFLINLLPVPILDGGHLVFFAVEALRGAPLSMRKMEIAQQVGLILLISLMVLSLFNDITSLVRSPW